MLWVGLPAIRGPKGISDMLFLDALYRDGAGKAGITYVDVWDGFVDEAGRFLQKGPDFEGQPRQLRSYDGVYFTKPGARKLAHYVDREIARLLAGRSGPIALPSEPATPDTNAVPGQPAPRPMAGPIIPLVAASIGTDQLLGGPGTRPAAGRCAGGAYAGEGRSAGAARRPCRRFPLAAPRSRPRTGQGRYAGGERRAGRHSGAARTAAATVAAAAAATATRIWPASRCSLDKSSSRSSRPAQNTTPSLFFGGFGTAPAPRQVAPPGTAPRPPANNGAPRPPANVGRSAEVPPAIHALEQSSW